jgi:fructose-1,6-bisphosphatase/inositol monophosphatase family enzyme
VTTDAVTSRFAVDVAFARDVAERAGRILLERYERVEQVDYKSARDVVTEVDHLSEALVIAAIRERYPSDGILAEESGAHRTSSPDGPGSLAAGRTWVIDPLDGTINYANGIPFFCVSIGLVVDGRPAAGVIHDPMRGETFWAAADGAAHLGEAPIQASDKAQLGDYVVSLALGGRAVATRVRAIRKAIRVSRNMGSAALALAYVANGRFDAFVQSAGMSAWDVAAAGLIAQRAGATVTDMAGGTWFDVERATRTFGMIAAPPGQHAELLRLAGEPG